MQIVVSRSPDPFLSSLFCNSGNGGKGLGYARLCRYIPPVQVEKVMPCKGDRHGSQHISAHQHMDVVMGFNGCTHTHAYTHTHIHTGRIFKIQAKFNLSTLTKILDLFALYSYFSYCSSYTELMCWTIMHTLV